jgi:hypothetical protein
MYIRGVARLQLNEVPTPYHLHNSVHLAPQTSHPAITIVAWHEVGYVTSKGPGERGDAK